MTHQTLSLGNYWKLFSSTIRDYRLSFIGGGGGGVIPIERPPK